MSEEKVAEWELSKENVKPLRQGRRMVQLTTALQTDTEEECLQKLEEQKRQYETDIRVYEGDDPLNPWFDYIVWFEQSYPTEGKKFAMLLKSCITWFNSDNKYFEDIRMLGIFIRYGNIVKDAVELYKYLFTNGKFINHAALYENWANELEKIGSYKDVENVLTLGESRNEELKEALAPIHRRFIARMVEHMNKDDLTELPAPITVEERQTLGGLKGAGRKKTVGSVRTGKAKEEATGITLGPAAIVQGNIPFVAFHDSENVAPIPFTSQASRFPDQDRNDRENTIQPGKWNKVTTLQRRGLVSMPRRVLDMGEVYVDPDAKTPEKQPITQPKPNALGTVKDAFTCERLHFESTDTVPHKYMCDLNKLYAGTEEFSIEELQAAKYFSNVRIRKTECYCERVFISPPNPLKKYICNNQRLYPTDTEEFSYEELLVPLWMAKYKKRLEEKELADQKRAMEYERECLRMKREKFELERMKLEEEKKLFQLRKEAKEHSIEALNPEHASMKSESDLQPFQQQSLLGSSANTPSSLPSVSLRDSDTMYKMRNLWTSRDDTSTESIDFLTHIPEYAAPPRKTFTAFSDSMAVPNDSFLIEPAVPQESNDMENIVCNDDENECDEKENTPPVNYIQQRISRAMSGILASSMTIPFCPIEDQEDDEEDEGTEHGSLFAGKTVTGELPRDLKFCSSTPFGCPVGNVKDEENSQTHFGQISYVAPFQVYNDNDENEVSAPVHCASHHNPTMTRTASHFGDADNLSVIYETSREYKTSSTSGSSRSTTTHSTFSAQTRTDSQYMQQISPHKSECEVTNAMIPDSEVIEISIAEGKELSYNEEKLISFTNETDIPIKEVSYNKEKLISFTNETDIPIKEVSYKEEKEVFYQEEREISYQEEKETSKSETNLTDVEVTDLIHFETPEPICHTDMEEISNSFGQLAIRGVVDPFDVKLIQKLLEKNFKPEDHEHLYTYDKKIPSFAVKKIIGLGKEKFNIEKVLAKGSYAKIYLSNSKKTHKKVALKVQTPAWPWEFYISESLKQRVTDSIVLESINQVTGCHLFNNGSVMETDFHEFGTILDVTNKSIEQHLFIPECIAQYFTLEMLRIVSELHRCKIIHADIKPDNWLVTGVPVVNMNAKREKMFRNNKPTLKLIDFGRSIDMSLYPTGTHFNTVVKTAGFTCNEMKDGRPWTYQTDLFSVAATSHCILFQDYMSLVLVKEKYVLTKSFKRYWNKQLWSKYFEILLNVESCDQLPVLDPIRKEFEADVFLSTKDDTFTKGVKLLTRICTNKPSTS